MRPFARVLTVTIVVGCIVPTIVTDAAHAARAESRRATGIGTRAALDGPHCDPETGNVAVPISLIPPCVRPFPDGGDNGGATAPGVTATTIKVVALLPNEEQEIAFRSRGQALPRNAGTGDSDTWQQAFADMAAPYEAFFEQWGRTVEFEFYTSTGSDEPEQRADAVAIIDKRPFAVIAVPGGIVLQTELAAAKILVFGTATNTEGRTQSPYRWGSFATDTAAAAVNTGEFAAKSLAGRSARWAGDDTPKGRPRTLVALYPRPSPRNDFDIEYFNDAFRQYAKRGDPLPVAVPYESQSSLTAASAEYQAQAPLLVTRLKEAGATTVVLFGNTDLVREVLAQATAQDFFPEWVLTAFALLDVNILARSLDQAQWAHAFGIAGQLPPVVKPTAEPNTGIYGWYWGQDQGTTTPLLIGHLAFLYVGLHMAGPRLTAERYKQGMFAMPRVGGAAVGQVNSFEEAFGPAAELPYDEYLAVGLDSTLVWWSGETPLPPNASGAIAFPGTGTYFYLNGAKRYHAGTWPKGLPRFFDPSVSTAALDPLPASDVPPPYPCPGCPSSAS